MAYAKHVGEAPPAAAAPEVREVDGVKLFLSSRSNTGYKGVFTNKSGASAARPFHVHGNLLSSKHCTRASPP